MAAHHILSCNPGIRSTGIQSTGIQSTGFQSTGIRIPRFRNTVVRRTAICNAVIRSITASSRPIPSFTVPSLTVPSVTTPSVTTPSVTASGIPVSGVTARNVPTRSDSRSRVAARAERLDRCGGAGTCLATFDPEGTPQGIVLLEEAIDDVGERLALADVPTELGADDVTRPLPVLLGAACRPDGDGQQVFLSLTHLFESTRDVAAKATRRGAAGEVQPLLAFAFELRREEHGGDDLGLFDRHLLLEHERLQLRNRLDRLAEGGPVVNLRGAVAVPTSVLDDRRAAPLGPRGRLLEAREVASEAKLAPDVGVQATHDPVVDVRLGARAERAMVGLDDDHEQNNNRREGQSAKP